MMPLQNLQGYFFESHFKLIFFCSLPTLYLSDLLSSYLNCIVSFDVQKIEDYQLLYQLSVLSFEFGAPPYGGIAFGLDLLVATTGRSDSISYYIAFPKNNKR